MRGGGSTPVVRFALDRTRGSGQRFSATWVELDSKRRIEHYFPNADRFKFWLVVEYRCGEQHADEVIACLRSADP